MQKALLIIGVVVILVALAWPWLKQMPLGRLPGDIVIERENVTFYLPVTSMILVSLVLSGLAWLFRR